MVGLPLQVFEDKMEEETLKDQRNKRARINRIKVGIVVFIVSLMLLSVIMNIILMIKTNSLQQQINNIVEYLNETPISAPVTTPETVEEQKLEFDDSIDEYQFSVVDNAENAYTEGAERRVYLTFDDGPSANTDKILDILAEYNVKATFFCIGKEDEESLARYKRIADEGHTLAMHSYSHAYSTIYASEESFKEDFDKLHKLLKDATGEDVKIYRFPGGSSNRVSDTDINVYMDYLGKNNVKYFDWNVSSGDASNRPYTSDELVENVVGDVVKYKESVVLMHDADSKDRTVEALPTILDKLLEMDCKILPITEDTPAIHHNKISTGG